MKYSTELSIFLDENFRSRKKPSKELQISVCLVDLKPIYMDHRKTYVQIFTQLVLTSYFQL